MSQIMFLYLGMMNSTLFIMMKHPMSMGMSLLIQTLIICMVTSSMAQNTWFSYILFLVFLGGMLVLFIYLTSVASNELFMKTSINLIISFMLMVMIMLLTMLLIDPLLMINSTEELNQNMNMNQPNKMTLNLFNYPNNVLTTFMVIYLFLTLIVVVSITESSQGPLRTSDL
uniref:NADH-ubiquinone oxidoreductase chain 6 n=1 Tax=Agriocnemis femina TaxID=1168618 RepID=A0A6C0R3Q5_9ODON|nr:NADH dehydrogenase subunit 6 [Agriocnemis femina]